MITADGQRFCSGAMVNNVRQDGKQYFLTAHHCIFSDVSYFMVGFNYQWNHCRSSTNSTTVSNEPRPQLAQGMQLISNNNALCANMMLRSMGTVRLCSAADQGNHPGQLQRLYGRLGHLLPGRHGRLWRAPP